MAGRFIKLYDKILDWEWYGDTNTFRLFIHLLLKANYKDSTFQGIKIKRGQFVTSLTSISTSTGLTIRQARDSLDKLKMTGEVTSKAYPKFRVITVVKYDEYQSNDKQNGRQMTSTPSSEGQANDRQTDKQNGSQTSCETATSIEYIELQNSRNIENYPSDSLVQQGCFDRFWSLYPRKEAKKNAEAAWKKLKMNEDLYRTIMTGLHKWIDSDQWTRDGGRYIPLPATWLNGHRWEDEVRKTEIKSHSTAPAPARVLPAQDFSQRDYSRANDDLMAQLAKEMADFEKTGDVK